VLWAATRGMEGRKSYESCQINGKFIRLSLGVGHMVEGLALSNKDIAIAALIYHCAHACAGASTNKRSQAQVGGGGSRFTRSKNRDGRENDQL